MGPTHGADKRIGRGRVSSRWLRLTGSLMSSLIQMDTAAPKVITVKLDLTYWPTWELVLDPVSCKWIRRVISHPLA
jgi:hypothetical protein